MKTGHEFHDDIQGILQTALTGVTQYTFRQYRTTGLVFPHVAQGDVFSMAFQCSHRKKLGAAMDGVHLHIIPVAAANGNVKLSYTWGWYNPAAGETVPATLPNSGSVEFTLATTDQYKLKIESLISNLTAPASE